jgi:protease I
MAKIVLIIAQEGFRDEEYAVPKEILQGAGHEVITASTARGEARGKLGMVTQVDRALDEIDAGEYDAIACIGGPGSKQFWDFEPVHALLRAGAARGAVVAGICSAAVTLAYAGVLKDKRATVFPGDAELFEPHVGQYTAAPCETDGRCVTANGPGAAEAFGMTIRDFLA